jgi:putative lipoprotein
MRILTLIALLVLSALVLSACGGGSASITGDVTYLQRIALPDDAVVTVQLQDISKQDVAADILGEQEIKTEGKQVPIAYEVEYDEGEIEDNHTYSMSARITDGTGKLLFISDTVIPVITRGNPTADVEIMTVPVG